MYMPIHVYRYMYMRVVFNRWIFAHGARPSSWASALLRGSTSHPISAALLLAPVLLGTPHPPLSLHTQEPQPTMCANWTCRHQGVQRGLEFETVFEYIYTTYIQTDRQTQTQDTYRRSVLNLLRFEQHRALGLLK